MLKYIVVFFTCCTLPLYAGNPSYAGFRASRILNSYPHRVFPSPLYWSNTGKLISQKFTNAQPAGIWIVSLYIDNGVTQFNFPSGGISLPYVNFISTDQNEAYLTHFDSTGIKVWLQVEPGEANIDTLISLVLNRYKHHKSVVGFGVDVEWYKNNSKVTDSSAQRWEQKVHSIDSTYSLFLKHYSKNYMPPTYRGKILFVDDSQDFNFAANPFSAMVSEFKSWALKFSPNKSAFQFGYPADSVWWKQFPDPMKTIGDALSTSIPTLDGLFWVDFTLTKVFPITNVEQQRNPLPLTYSIEQNFPNPFNPITTIEYSLKNSARVTLVVYDLFGREVQTIVDEFQLAGTHTKVFDASHLSSGTYFYQIKINNNAITVKKMTLIK